MMPVFGVLKKRLHPPWAFLQFLHRFVTIFTQRLGILQSQAGGAATADLHMIPPHTQSNTPHRAPVPAYRKRRGGGLVRLQVCRKHLQHDFHIDLPLQLPDGLPGQPGGPGGRLALQG